MAMVSARNNDSLPDTNPSLLNLRWNGEDYPLQKLDEFTFVVRSRELANTHTSVEVPTVLDGAICGADEIIEIQFRIRSTDNGLVACGFFDLAISTRDRLAMLAERSASPDSDALQSLSYDELALGNTDKESDVKPPSRKGSSTLKKVIVSGALAASMLLTAGWVIMVVRSQSTVSVSNSVMVGNYQPVNAPLEGKLLDMRVAIGDRVKAGQVLATIANPVVEHELSVFETKISRARRDLDVYRRQSIEIDATLKAARLALRTKRLIAVTVKSRIKADLRAAQAHFIRLKRLDKRGFGRASEFEKARGLRDSLVAELESQNAVIDGIVLAEKAAANEVIVNDARVTNPMSEIRTKIALAQSLIAELRATRDLVAAKAKPAELLAPSRGTVFAVYRRPGEVLKHADEVIAISRDGASWATGHIRSDLAANIKPGQRVEIEIPSFGVNTTGIVEGVGHRAVHGRGGYTADFRGGPLDVPIRVAINQTSKRIPSGLRLNMTIRVRDRLKELNDWIGGWTALAAHRETSPDTFPKDPATRSEPSVPLAPVPQTPLPSTPVGVPPKIETSGAAMVGTTIETQPHQVGN